MQVGALLMQSVQALCSADKLAVLGMQEAQACSKRAEEGVGLCADRGHHQHSRAA